MADPPGHLGVVELASRANLDTVMWSSTSRNWIARPQKVLVDRVQELVDDPSLSAVWSRLTVAQRNVLVNRLRQMLGRERFRNPAETTDIT